MLSEAESKQWWDICQVNGWMNNVFSSNLQSLCVRLSSLVWKNWTRNPLGPFPSLQFGLPFSFSCSATPQPIPTLIHNPLPSLELLHGRCWWSFEIAFLIYESKALWFLKKAYKWGRLSMKCAKAVNEAYKGKTHLCWDTEISTLIEFYVS